MDHPTPPRSRMPEYGTDVIARDTPKLAKLVHNAAAEIIVRGLTAGDSKPDVTNHALSAMCALASTALLACVEKLIETNPGTTPDVAARLIAADVDLRFVTAIQSAIANPPPASDGGKA